MSKEICHIYEFATAGQNLFLYPSQLDLDLNFWDNHRKWLDAYNTTLVSLNRRRRLNVSECVIACLDFKADFRLFTIHYGNAQTN